jgi:Na+/H+-dicarboxylate symporter
MLNITGYVMKLAPIAVFAPVAAVITTQGRHPGQLRQVRRRVLSSLLSAVGAADRGRPCSRHPSWRAGAAVREPFLLAFSTASSEAAYPKILEQLQKFGVSRRDRSFVLPLGYSFNLDGTMMYCTFATMFIAQAYGIHMPIGKQIAMLRR